MDYKNGQIYTIRSKSCPDLVYVGSTCQPLHKRLYAHRSKFDAWQEGHSAYYAAFEILKIGDEHIEWVEDFPTDSKKKLEKREGEIVRSMQCVNKHIPGRSPKEYRDEQNKEAVKTYHKEWYKKNKDTQVAKCKARYQAEKQTILARQNKKAACECGVMISHCNMPRHYQSFKHIKWFIWH